jgi:hypothetical protein
MMKLHAHPQFLFLLLAPSLVMIGCSNLATTPTDRLDETGVKPTDIEGILYYLPAGKLRIVGGPPAQPKQEQTGATPPGATPTAAGGGTPPASSPTSPSPFVINAGDNYAITITPVIEADPHCYYYLKPKHNFAYDDAIDLKVGSNGLLNSSNVTTTDETVNIASSIASMVAQGGFSLPLSTQEIQEKSKGKTIADLLALVQAFEQSSSRDTLIPTEILNSLASNLKSEINSQGLDVPKSADYFALLYATSAQIPASALEGYLANFKAQSTVVVPTTFGNLMKALQDLKSKTDKPKPFDIVVDPEDTHTMENVKEIILKVAKLHFSCEDDRVQGHLYRFPLDSVDFYGQKDPYVDGVAFRPMKAWKVSLVSTIQKDSDIPPVDTHQIIILPDKYHTLVIAYDRMPFVAKTTNVGFTNGMLTEYSETVPSPILGALGLPKAILQALLPIPTTTSKSSAGSTAK